MRHKVLLFVLIGLALAACRNTTTAPVVAATPFVITATSAPPRLTPTATPQPGGVADHNLGPDKAFLTIMLYGDFQCGPCFEVARVLAILRDRYPNDVRIVWRHFPQQGNDKARLAAQASEAASAQGRFWEMHDQLFTQQARWSGLPVDQFRAQLTAYAKLIGVADLNAFNAALDSQTYAPLIEQAVKQALDLDLKGAPVLLFNGLPYSGRIDEFALDTFTRLKLLEKRWHKQSPDLIIDPKKKYTATLVTQHGNVVIELLPQAAPIAVNNFVFLARAGWYNTITFHRVLPGQLAQTGDPSGSGFGTAGYTILDETDNGMIFDREGLVAMAGQRDTLDSASSQFFISLGPLRPALDYDKRYTIFGRVTAGMDVLRKLTPRDPFDELRYPNPPPGDKLISVQIAESQ